MSSKYAFVMMVKEKYWIEYRNRLNGGRDVHSYIVRGAAPPIGAKRVLFYVTRRVKELRGYADFVERKVGKPQELWAEYSSESVLKSRQEFDQFSENASIVSFVRFKNLRVAANPIPLRSLLIHLATKRISRKGFYIDKETADKLVSTME